MKNFAKYSFLIVIILLSTVLSGCWLFDYSEQSGTDYVPAVFTKNTMTLSWSSSANVQEYEVVVNDNVVATYNNNQDNFSYDIRNALVEGQVDYTFYVLGHTSLRTIKSSEFRYTKATSTVTDEVTNYVLNNTKCPTNISVVDSVALWQEMENAKRYIVVVIEGQNNIQYFETTYNSIDLKEYSQRDKVYGIRIGVQYNDDENIYLSESEYMNTEDDFVDEKYLETVYYFAGNYYDYYINNQDELNNLVYYAFIYKKTSVDFAVNSNFMNTNGNIGSYISTASDNIHETCNYSISRQGGEGNTLKLTFNYYGVTEPSLATVSNVEAENIVEPYYEGMEIQSDLDFVNDNSLIEVFVSTSEELVWAIEYGAKPLMSETSVAYDLYTTAKGVLNSIILEDMTEYEKCLCVFDWISANTVYDHEVVDLVANNQALAVQYNCFYLEGVFYDGIAVCDGYSKAYSLMMNMLGIPCVKISGQTMSNGSKYGHAWNKVAVDMDDDGEREWYVVDITWANLSVVDNGVEKEIISHKYFMVSDRTISTTHIPLSQADEGKEANNTANYYEYMTFEYLGKTYNFVVKNAGDVLAIQSYVSLTGKTCEVMLLSSVSAPGWMTVSGDYNYNATNTSYGSFGRLAYAVA